MRRTLTGLLGLVLFVGALAAPAQAQPPSTADELESTGAARCEESGSSKGDYECTGVADGCVGTWYSDSNDPDSDDKHWASSVCVPGDDQ